MVQHEDEQAHRRLSWFGTFQGFLFASLGFSWGKNTNLTLIICLLGFAVAILIAIGVGAYVMAIKRIHACWIEHKPLDYNGPGIIGYFPIRWKFSVWTSAEMLLPLCFAVAWASAMFFAHGPDVISAAPPPLQTADKEAPLVVPRQQGSH